MTSLRNVPADIPDENVISSSFHKLDVKKQLREAGHPFNFIGTELTKLDGRFEVVSKDVELLGKKIDTMNTGLSQMIETTFQSKFFGAGSISVGVICGLYALGGFVRQKSNLTTGEFYWLAAAFAIGISVFGWLCFTRRNIDIQ